MEAKASRKASRKEVLQVDVTRAAATILLGIVQRANRKEVKTKAKAKDKAKAVGKVRRQWL